MVVLLIAGVSIYLVVSSSSRDNNQEKNGTRRDVVVTPENVDEILAALEETNPDSSYTASMNVDWFFDDGTSPSKNAFVENAPENSRTVYFDILLIGTSEMVYSSPYIPVGSSLKNITLQTALGAGDYDAVCLYHLVDDNENEISTVSVAVTLHILN